MAEVRIGLVGAGWMGRAHSTAYKNVPLVFGNDPAVPTLEMVADIDEGRARAGAESMGFRRWTADWRELVNDPNVDAVDITATNDVHTEIAIAAAQAGKPVYCEKPIAMNAPDAKRMVEAAEAAGVTTLVGFNYLKIPSIAYARELIRAGDIGDITLFRGTFDQDFMSDPGIPFSWRHDRKLAGSGALGDMASHVLSISQFLVGDIAEVCGHTGIFVKERPVAASGSGHTARAAAGAPTREVENDDTVQFLARFDNGAMGVIESTRVGTGRKMWLTFEIQGSKGALWFTHERMNELLFYRHTDPPAERGYKTVLTNAEQPFYGAFHPIAGVEIGYNDQKVIEARALIEAVSSGEPAEPDFRFGHKVLQVVDAVQKSGDERRWVGTDEVG